MESIYINFQNCCVKSLGEKTKGKIKRVANKFLEVVTSADACDLSRRETCPEGSDHRQIPFTELLGAICTSRIRLEHLSEKAH